MVSYNSNSGDTFIFFCFCEKFLSCACLFCASLLLSNMTLVYYHFSRLYDPLCLLLIAQQTETPEEINAIQHLLTDVYAGDLDCMYTIMLYIDSFRYIFCSTSHMYTYFFFLLFFLFSVVAKYSNNGAICQRSGQVDSDSYAGISSRRL